MPSDARGLADETPDAAIAGLVRRKLTAALVSASQNCPGDGECFEKAVALTREITAALRQDAGAAMRERPHIASARLTAWQDENGGVEIVFDDGFRVAVALDAPHPASGGAS